MVGNVQNPDYETVTAERAHRSALYVFNRIHDIGDVSRIDGRYVTCFDLNDQSS